MSISDKQPSLQRRRVLHGAVLSGAALTVPGLATAVCGSGDHQLTQEEMLETNSTIAINDVTIELVETETSLSSGKLARVSVTNISKRAIKLSDVSPEPILTNRGVYKLNATLTNNPLSIRPGGVYQFWLTPEESTLHV